MSFRVELTARALRDLDRLMAWLAERSPGSEDRLSTRLYQVLPRLETNPFVCGFAYENPDFPEELRHLLFETRKNRVYRVLFIIRGDVVKVLCIRAPGEKPVRPDDTGI